MKKTLTKRIIAILTIFVMLFSLSLVSYAEENPITVLLDGEQLTFDVNPVLENGRTLVPMRVIFEALGAKVDWDQDTWTAIATKDDIKIEISIDSTQMLKNGEIVTLDVPAKLIDGRTLVPVRAVSEGLGANVDWNNDLWQVIITTAEETPKPEQEVTPESTKEEYDFTQLSPGDTEILKRDAAQLRYLFEQNILPSAFLADAEYAIPLIKEKDSTLATIVDALWEETVIPYIITIQTESEDVYSITDELMNEISDEAFYAAYANIMNETGLSANNLFSVSYDKTPAGKPLLLVTFNSADEILNCKYIAMTVSGNTLRCFTCETTISATSEDKYMLCEITQKGRGSYLIVNDKDTFFKGIDNVIKANATPSASQPR